MSIIEASRKHFSQEEPNSLVSLNKVCNILSENNEFVMDVLDCFFIKNDKQSLKMPIIIGNTKQLLDDIKQLDLQTEKIDVTVNLKDIFLEHILENDHVLFHIYGLQDPDLLKAIKADHLVVESQYSSRGDIMEYYQFSKFSKFLHANDMDAYAKQIWDKLRVEANKNIKCMARLIYHKADEKFYIRAVTSENGYKKYGVNFSILVTLLAINDYVQNRQEHAFIESYNIDDSHIIMSIQFDRKIKLDDDMYLTLGISLENDEIRQSSVSLNAEFKVIYQNEKKESSIILKPSRYQKAQGNYSEDMLTFTHGMNVKTAIEKISDLPILIDRFIELISNNAIGIKSIKDPNQVKDFIQHKIQNSRKEEFIGYKEAVVRKLTRIDVNSVFDLFELLRDVEELFGDDILSRNFWRQKLYDVLINHGRDE